jgi:poly(A) polymerase
VTAVFALPEAYTPVLKFNMGDIAVDMLFCSLPEQRLPEVLNVQDENLLRHLDEQGVRSLNGVRVAELMLAVSNECIRVLVAQ